MGVVESNKRCRDLSTGPGIGLILSKRKEAPLSISMVPSQCPKPSAGADLRLPQGTLARRRQEANIAIINNQPRKIAITDEFY